MFLATSIAFAAMRFFLPSTSTKAFTLLANKKLWRFFCGIFLVAYVLLVLLSTFYIGYLEHVEPHIASVSFIVLHGAPLYHTPTSALRYTFPYGPMTYLPYVFALHMLGASVLSLKLVVLLANLSLLGMLWWSYRRVLGPPYALLVTTIVIVYLLQWGDNLLQVRGDILLVSSVALGLSATLSTTWPAVLLLSLACALGFDIKATSLLYFLPLYVLMIRRHGWLPAGLAAVGSALLAYIPFLSPRISLPLYLEWLHLLSREPLTTVGMSLVIEMLVVLCAPVGLLLWQAAARGEGAIASYRSENQLFIITLSFSIATVAITATKVGAGPHHLMPLCPILGYACADLYREIKDRPALTPLSRSRQFIPLLWSWLVIAVLLNFGIAFSLTVRSLLANWSRAYAVTDDLKTVMSEHPSKTIEMGYGESISGYRLTYYRPALVFAGNPVFIDPMALDDMQIVGVEMPPGTLQYLQNCKTQIWLIPKGDTPFRMENVFSQMYPERFHALPLFTDEFRGIFLKKYRKQSSSEYFDIWECDIGDKALKL
jgi:hypothetical protein